MKEAPLRENQRVRFNVGLATDASLWGGKEVFDIAQAHDGQEATIETIVIRDLECRKNREFYDIEFADGTKMAGISGMRLSRLD